MLSAVAVLHHAAALQATNIHSRVVLIKMPATEQINKKQGELPRVKDSETWHVRPHAGKDLDPLHPQAVGPAPQPSRDSVLCLRLTTGSRNHLAGTVAMADASFAG